MVKLYGIFARAAESAVIFRRGPSKMARLIRWNLREHTFEPGQWFKGRIYERKSDLSPDGEKLVYFAGKHHGDPPTWIAVSAPPYLTAIVLWRGLGTWNDISLFDTDGALALATHGAHSSLTPEPGFATPRPLEVRAKPWPGFFYRLEDHERLVRDGWTVHAGDPVYGRRSPMQGDPVVYRRPIPDGGTRAWLELSGRGGNKLTYAIVDAAGDRIDLQAEWADARENEVFYSQGGKLLRRRVSKNGKRVAFEREEELADFTEMQFESVEAPDFARRW